MGDTVLTTALLRELRLQIPHAHITLLVPTRWVDAINNHPALNEVWTFDTLQPFFQQLWQWGQLLHRIRNSKFDICLGLHAGAKVENLCLLSNADIRIAHNHDLLKRNRVIDRTIPNKGVVQPIWERDLDVLRALGLKNISIPKTQLFVSEHETKWAKNFLASHGLNPPFLSLGLGASRATKIWPMEYFAKMAWRWRQTTQGCVLAFFTEDECHLYNQLLSEIASATTAVAIKNSLELATASKNEPVHLLKPHWLIPINRSPLREVMSLISLSHQFIGNDSGPKHMAVALNVPTLTVFGPEHPFEWHPYDTSIHKILFMDGLPCRTNSINGQPKWCGLSQCIKEDHRCLKHLTPDQAWAALRPLSESKSPFTSLQTARNDNSGLSL